MATEVEEEDIDGELKDTLGRPGAQLGVRDGSEPGTRAIGDGTGTNGNNTTKNAKPKECVREAAPPSTKFKR